MDVNYQKRKNNELFKQLSLPNILNLNKIINYIPIYNVFFNLTETNIKYINLDHEWYLHEVLEIESKQIASSNSIIRCNIKNIHNDDTKTVSVFFKMAPLLDTYKYLLGKYNNSDITILPMLGNNALNTREARKMNNVNNSSYVDGFFYYLISQLYTKYNFVHGIEYYGSFLSIKNK